MRLDSLLTKPQLARDLLVGFARSDEPQHLGLALSQGLEGTGKRYFAHQARRGLLRELDLASRRCLQRLAELARVGVFEEIADRTGTDSISDRTVLDHAGQRNDLDVSQFRPDCGCGADPVHHRHQQIHEDDVGQQVSRQFDGLLTVGSLANHLELVLGVEEHPKALTHDAVIVDHENADGHLAAKTYSSGWMGQMSQMHHPSVGPPPILMGDVRRKAWGVAFGSELLPMVRVFVVDPLSSVREGLRMRLGVEHDLAVVGAAESVAPAVSYAMSSSIDVLIIEIDGLGGEGITGIATFKAARPGARIVVLSFKDDARTRSAATRAGADAFIGKHEPAHALIEAIRG